MAVVSFIPKISGQDWTSKVCPVPPGLQAGQRVLLACSDLISNNSGANGANLNIVFEALSPNIPGASFDLTFVVEGKDAEGNWFDLGYQFSPFVLMSIAPKRRIVIDPTVDTFNDGIDSSVYVAGTETTRISRSRAILPPDGFRICLYLTDSNPGPTGFQSVTCSVSGEKVDV